MDCFGKKEDGERKENWNGELSSEAEKLLEYHGAMNGLNKMQMACVYVHNNSLLLSSKHCVNRVARQLFFFVSLLMPISESFIIPQSIRFC